METVLRNVPLITGFRRMVYAVTPNETRFENADDVPRYIDEATPFFFVCIILEFLISSYKHDDNYRINDNATSVSAGLFSRLPTVLLKSIQIVGYVWVYDNYRIAELPWDSAWTWWLAFILVDLGYYWFHRMAHGEFLVGSSPGASQFRGLQLNYSLETICVTSLYIMGILFTYGVICTTLGILGSYGTKHPLSILDTYKGPLEYILNTPSHHRVHHGRNRYCIDKNYAGTLIIWDRLFGTFEQENEEVVYGLTHPINTFGPLEIQFGYLKYMVERFVTMKGIVNKMGVLLCGPGWSPGKPRSGDIQDIPDVKAPCEKYHTKIPLWVNVYTSVHFLIIIVVQQELVARKMGMSQVSVLLTLLYVVYALTCFGNIFDQKSSFPRNEIVRCLVSLAGEIFLCNSGFYGVPGDRPIPMYALHGVFILSTLLWTAVTIKQGMETVSKSE